MQMSTIESFAIIFCFVLIIVVIDNLRGKRAKKLNSLGLCAKCGKPLNIMSESILVSGGGRGSGESAYVCHKCASKNKLIFWGVMTLIAIALLVEIIIQFVLK